MSKLSNAFILALLIASFFLLLREGWNRHEISECMGWNTEAQNIIGYWFTDWQIAQCEAHGIKLVK